MEFNTPQAGLEDVLYPILLGGKFGDRYTVFRRPKGGGDPIEQDVFLRGVEYESDGDIFRTSFILQDASRFSYFVIGDPILGRIGYNAIAF
jgi:hypothetical protein